jgi:outer membrane protein assembly factor BamB
MRSLVLALCFFACFQAQADDWPQWGGPKRDGVWRDSEIIESIPSSGLKVRWRARVSNGYSGPAVAKGRVYLTDRLSNPDRERVLCFNETDGTKLWEHSYRCEYGDMEYGNGPRATPTVHDDRVYTFGTRGHLVCLDTKSGSVNWKKDLVAEYKAVIPRYGASAAPLVWDDLLIVYAGGQPDALMIAFDRQTGEERWKALPDRPAYSAPIVIRRGDRQQLITWSGDAVHSLNPKTGKSYWSMDYKCAWDVAEVIATPVLQDDRLLFLKGWGRGALMLRLDSGKPAAAELWRTRSDPSTLMATPVFSGPDHFISIHGQKGICFNSAEAGKQLWSDRRAIGAARMGYAHPTPNGDRMFIFNQSGHLILGRATTNGFEQLGDTLLVEPTLGYRAQGPVAWSHPAYANKSVFARNDRELVCASLAAADYDEIKGVSTEQESKVQILGKFIGMSAARAVCFSPDGSTLAAGTMVGTVRRVDPKTGEAPTEPRRRGRQRNRSHSIAWSGDGKLIAVARGTEFRQASNNRQTSGYVRRWNAADHKELPELAGLSNNVMSVAFSPDSQFLATGGADNIVRLWNSQTGKPLRALNGHTDAIWTVAFSASGEQVISAGWDRTVRVWNSATGKQLAALRGHEDEIMDLAVSPDGRHIATGGADWTVRLWDLRSLKQAAVLKGHNGSIYSLAFSSDGKRLFSGSGDETVRVWNVAQRKTISTLRSHQSGVRAMALAPDDKTLATTGIDDALRLWRLE